jgi:hypothetical protein
MKLMAESITHLTENNILNLEQFKFAIQILKS